MDFVWFLVGIVVWCYDLKFNCFVWDDVMFEFYDFEWDVFWGEFEDW